jgi:hypothetical protein
MLYFMLFLRVLWQWFPSLLTCVLFWYTVFTIEVRQLSRAEKVNWWSKTPGLIGAAMNAAVTITNDGRMPVLSTKFRPVSLWVAGTGKHLLFLCDRFDGRWAILSLGDFFIIGGILIPIVQWLIRRSFKSENPLNSAISDSK